MANNKGNRSSKGSKGNTAVPPSKEKNMSVDQILDVLRRQSGDTITISAKRLEALCKEIKQLRSEVETLTADKNQNDEQETPDANQSDLQLSR